MASRDLFTTVRTEGGLLPADFLQRIASGDRSLDGLTPDSYHLAENERLNEATNRAWNRLVGAWATFKAARKKIEAGDLGTTLTRERWLLVLFQELGYGRLVGSKTIEIAGKSYPISHSWNHTPIHLVGCNVELDRRTKGAKGAAGASPHGLVQEFLNRSEESLWGIVSNGLCLRLLRDNVSLTRQAYVEFDLEAMMEGDVYSDFVLLWVLCHQSRVEADRLEECWLERWSAAAREQGTRALDRLRVGVEAAIEALGRGFLAHPRSTHLREELRVGTLDKQDYYRQLLRLVYRLLFLFVAEDRGLLLDPTATQAAKERYWRYYSTVRLRRLAQRRRGSPHADLYQGFRVVMEKLGTDSGCVTLGLPALGSFLWSSTALPHLEREEISNADLLDAVRALAFTVDGKVLRAIDYKNLAAEELGSVYESLLELHPDITAIPPSFKLTSAGGHERKTTGSYYTPESLVQCLLDSALDPVLDEACEQSHPEDAILSLKVCDPACGSGHFLIAAAHHIAKRLAAARTGDDEPSPEATRTALRAVIGHCVYGVDLNPMAVELCKVSLWMEALEPGKPLSFLDHHIQGGNSLLGATPALIEKGIPDEAFQPIEGDDKELLRSLKKQNKQEREGQMTMFADFVADTASTYGALTETVAALDAIDDDSIAAVHQKEARYRQFADSPIHAKAKVLADAWCAAFVWKKTQGAPEAITHDVLIRLQRNPNSVSASVRLEIKRLADQYKFLHWHLAFPDVFRAPANYEKAENELRGWSGGFDCIVGNPPWDKVELMEKEWFAEKRPDIASAQTGAKRKQLIRALETEDPGLYRVFLDASRRAGGERNFIQNSGRYPLCGSGRINTYATFAETTRLLVATTGRIGCILPSGIGTDDSTKFFFQELVKSQTLRSLYDFENKHLLFPAVAPVVRFCLLTISGVERPAPSGADFIFFAQSVEDLLEPARRFSLTSDEIKLINPNSQTCPIFKSNHEAEITKRIYRRNPVLVRQSPPTNPWRVVFRQGLFNMTSDSEHFVSKGKLEAQGFAALENRYVRGDQSYLPLYEAKLVHQFDHRHGTFQGLEGAEIFRTKAATLSPTESEKRAPDFLTLPRYWVLRDLVEANIPPFWKGRWFLVFRDIIQPMTNARCAVFAVIPREAVGNNLPMILTEDSNRVVIVTLLAIVNSFVFDFTARQKIGGTHLNFYIVEQLPVLPPTTCGEPCPWSGAPSTLREWLLPRVLELTYTAWDLEPFAQDCGWNGPPFRWDEARRFVLRRELDAAFFHLYGIARDDVDYIMETFPIVKRKDMEKHGDYRTKLVILDIYDRMQRAIETGEPYQTPLDPPPADPRVAHPASKMSQAQ